ncbi:shikimate dehydrogenase [Microbacterium sp. Root61]|nr:shikimate dehydrogenase [Microbacterium sp. Root61]
MLTDRTRLTVWGDPIAHSRSPQLHAAAYGVLGLDWTYDRRRVAASEFSDALASLDDGWRGLSVTFPLKAEAFSAARTLDRRAELTGAVNTLLLEAPGPRGFNTDVGGITRSLQEHGLAEVPDARIIGAGATATSALVALSELGARRVEVAARRPEAVAPLIDLGERLGVTVVAIPLAARAFTAVALSIATLPGDTALPEAVNESLAASGGPLLDVVYGTWPTALADAWQRTGGTAISGLGMLLHQAVLQVRVFVSGDPNTELTDERAVLAAMRSAVVGD